MILCSLSVKAGALTSYQATPATWKTEVIAFPLAFSPEIKLKGAEELVFSPGMYEPSEADFFSYAFSWLIETPTTKEQLSVAELKQNLVFYYEGLYKAVAKEATADVTITMDVEQDGKWQYKGQIQWVEPFKTKQLQILNFKAFSVLCENEQRWYFNVSPQMPDHNVWSQLALVKEKSCG